MVAEQEGVVGMAEEVDVGMAMKEATLVEAMRVAEMVRTQCMECNAAAEQIDD